jgi:hypothetical protein
MNINKLQAQLQHVPDQALISYVQNPDGQVPSYLALAELNRRKEIRKSAQPQQAAPTQTVAAQQVAQAAPGIAQLPVREDMFNEQSMAAGGIVAFEGGGGVGIGDYDPGYRGYPIDAPGMSERDLAYADAARNSKIFQYGGDALKTLFAPAYVMGDKGLELVRDYTYGNLPGTDPKTGKRYAHSRDIPKPDADAAYKAEGEAQLKKRQEYLNANPSVAPQFASKAVPKDTGFRPYAPNTNPVEIAERQAAILKQKYGPKAAAEGAPGVGAAPRAVTPAGIGSLYKAPTDISGEYEGLMRPETGARENMDKYAELIGPDKGREAMQERLRKMEARAAQDEAQSPWMALAEAGLGIASGKSQFALQNIAEGGKQGIKSFIDAKDRMVKAEERRFDIASKISQAERAEQVAAATYGLQSEERAKAHNDTVKQAKLGYKADREAAIAKGTFDAKKFDLEYAQKDREIGLMDKRIDKQIASAESQGLRYELQNKRDSLKTALNEINDLIKTEQGLANPDPTKIAGLQRKFDTAYNALYSLAMNPSGNAPAAGGKKAPLDSFNLK